MTSQRGDAVNGEACLVIYEREELFERLGKPSGHLPTFACVVKTFEKRASTTCGEFLLLQLSRHVTVVVELCTLFLLSFLWVTEELRVLCATGAGLCATGARAIRFATR